jgi:hypothetical protein
MSRGVRNPRNVANAFRRLVGRRRKALPTENLITYKNNFFTIEDVDVSPDINKVKALNISDGGTLTAKDVEFAKIGKKDYIVRKDDAVFQIFATVFLRELKEKDEHGRFDIPREILVTKKGEKKYYRAIEVYDKINGNDFMGERLPKGAPGTSLFELDTRSLVRKEFLQDEFFMRGYAALCGATFVLGDFDDNPENKLKNEKTGLPTSIDRCGPIIKTSSHPEFAQAVNINESNQYLRIFGDPSARKLLGIIAQDKRFTGKEGEKDEEGKEVVVDRDISSVMAKKGNQFCKITGTIKEGNIEETEIIEGGVDNYSRALEEANLNKIDDILLQKIKLRIENGDKNAKNLFIEFFARTEEAINLAENDTYWNSYKADLNSQTKDSFTAEINSFTEALKQNAIKAKKIFRPYLEYYNQIKNNLDKIPTNYYAYKKMLEKQETKRKKEAAKISKQEQEKFNKGDEIYLNREFLELNKHNINGNFIRQYNLQDSVAPIGISTAKNLIEDDFQENNQKKSSEVKFENVILFQEGKNLIEIDEEKNNLNEDAIDRYQEDARKRRRGQAASKKEKITIDVSIATSGQNYGGKIGENSKHALKTEQSKTLALIGSLSKNQKDNFVDLSFGDRNIYDKKTGKVKAGKAIFVRGAVFKDPEFKQITNSLLKNKPDRREGEYFEVTKTREFCIKKIVPEIGKIKAHATLTKEEKKQAISEEIQKLKNYYNTLHQTKSDCLDVAIPSVGGNDSQFNYTNFDVAKHIFLTFANAFSLVKEKNPNCEVTLRSGLDDYPQNGVEPFTLLAMQILAAKQIGVNLTLSNGENQAEENVVNYFKLRVMPNVERIMNSEKTIENQLKEIHEKCLEIQKYYRRLRHDITNTEMTDFAKKKFELISQTRFKDLEFYEKIAKTNKKPREDLIKTNHPVKKTIGTAIRRRHHIQEEKSNLLNKLEEIGLSDAKNTNIRELQEDLERQIKEKPTALEVDHNNIAISYSEENDQKRTLQAAKSLLAESYNNSREINAKEILDTAFINNQEEKNMAAILMWTLRDYALEYLTESYGKTFDEIVKAGKEAGFSKWIKEEEFRLLLKERFTNSGFTNLSFDEPDSNGSKIMKNLSARIQLAAHGFFDTQEGRVYDQNNLGARSWRVALLRDDWQFEENQSQILTRDMLEKVRKENIFDENGTLKTYEGAKKPKPKNNPLSFSRLFGRDESKETWL